MACRRTWWWWVRVGLLCLFLGGCASPAKIAGDSGDATFDRTGRFALSVTYDGGSEPQAVQGGFAWRDDGATLQLDLANPLGSTLARIVVTPYSAVMTRANGERKQARDPDALVELVLGSPMPVAGLRDWLRGRTGPAAVARQEKDDTGRLVHFEQNGWDVALSRYDAAGPRLLQLAHGGDGRHVTVRLVVDSN